MQLQIRNVQAISDQQVQITVLLKADPDENDSRLPKQLAISLRKQSMDPNSDLMVLIPHVETVVTSGGPAAGVLVPGRERLLSTGNYQDEPENAVLQDHAVRLKQHLAEVMEGGGGEHATRNGKRWDGQKQTQSREQNLPGDAITEGFHSIMGTTGDVVSSLTPHVFPFMPTRRGYTYAWKGR